jgi:hypothetical protein
MAEVEEIPTSVECLSSITALPRRPRRRHPAPTAAARAGCRPPPRPPPPSCAERCRGPGPVLASSQVTKSQGALNSNSRAEVTKCVGRWMTCCRAISAAARPRRRVPFNATYEGAKCVLIQRRAISGRPCRCRASPSPVFVFATSNKATDVTVGTHPGA